jgi:hypothetical protein
MLNSPSTRDDLGRPNQQKAEARHMRLGFS